MHLVAVTYHYNFLSAVPYIICVMLARGTWLSVQCKESTSSHSHTLLKSYLYCRSWNLTELDLVTSEIKCLDPQHSYFALYLENIQELQEVCQHNPLHSKSWAIIPAASNKICKQNTFCPRYLFVLSRNFWSFLRAISSCCVQVDKLSGHVWK